MSGKIYVSKELTADVDVSCDVCIVGSGAGGAVLADGLVDRGLDVVMLEEGGWRTKADFDLQEGHAYPMMYQDRGTRATADLAISILQGRTVGGGTTVNWTTCFRTPDRVLDHWRQVHGVEGFDASTLGPHWDEIEKRLNIHEWPLELVNANNRALWDGCKALGHDVQLLRRNVNGCANSGYCGVGCPVDGKQSMMVTYVPDAVGKGLVVYANTRADRLDVADGKVTAVHATVLRDDADRPAPGADGRGVKVTVRPKVCVVSGGAINSPALLLRSGITDGPVGRRTFLHPVVAVTAMYDHDVNGWFGAPQSVASHHFVDRGEEVGFFLEVPPLQPMLASTGFPLHGQARADAMAQLKKVSTIIALCVDGLHGDVPGGTVTLKPDGRPRVDYPIPPRLTSAFRDAMKTAAGVAFAAGAKRVMSLHLDPVDLTDPSGIAAYDDREYGALKHSIFTAHQMGGCCMGPDPATSVVRPEDLRHHRVGNLHVVDGSVLPTALGVNPSETIYGIAHWARDRVAANV